MVLYTGDDAGRIPTLQSVMVSNIVTRGELTAAPHRVRSDQSPALDDANRTAQMYLAYAGVWSPSAQFIFDPIVIID